MSNNFAFSSELPCPWSLLVSAKSFIDFNYFCLQDSNFDFGFHKFVKRMYNNPYFGQIKNTNFITWMYFLKSISIKSQHEFSEIKRINEHDVWNCGRENLGNMNLVNDTQRVLHNAFYFASCINNIDYHVHTFTWFIDDRAMQRLNDVLMQCLSI